jgi:hypothetical protein
MSFFSRILFGAPASAAAVLGANALVGGSGIISPWSTPSEMLTFVYTDIYGAGSGLDAVTRDTAMTVAPIKRGRGVIVSKLADLPLELGTVDPRTQEFTADAQQPAWLTVTRHPQSPWHRLALTLDDLLFYGWSLWVLERDEAGAITDAGRIAYERWEFDATAPTGVSVDGKQVANADDVLLIAGPDEGLLITGRDSIRGWRHMEAAWVGRVRNPIPAMVLHEKTDGGVSQAEAQQYVNAWAEARTSPNGAVGFLPSTLDLEVHGQPDADMFDKGRNAARIDLANHMNLPVEAVGGSTATASLTYSTEQGSRIQLVDDLEYYAGPLEAALRSDKVAGPGKAIRLNRAFLTALDPSTEPTEGELPA